MNTFYGPFRALEKEFVSYVTGIKPGPERPVLVLCPSGRIAEQLKCRLVLKQGLISNLFFVTFSQLLSALDREIPGPRLPLLPGDTLHDYLLKNLLTAPGLDRYRFSRGFVTALRASLRDLADGLAVPEVLAEHLQTTQNPILEEDAAHIHWLVRVFEAYETKMEQVPGYRSYKTYFAQALAQAEKSPWLGQFAEIILYGFYELTGRQLEIFNTLRTRYPLTVFWLYSASPAFLYGRKFFEANILGVSQDTKALAENEKIAVGEALSYLFTSKAVQQTPPGLQVISCPNVQRELFFVAKEMLRLHEEEKIPYADMAVTARSLAPYQTELPSVFAQHGVPLQADFAYAWTTKPLGVFLINLLSLVRRGFDKDDILSVVNSPYFKQKNNWRYLISESLAKRDYAQWTSLVHPVLASYDPVFLEWLARTKEQLEALETSDTWEHLYQTAWAFLQENTNIDLFNAEEKQTWQQLKDTLDGFKRYAAVAARAGAREFLDELFAAIQTVELHQVIDMPSGVTVADVGALRGLGFRVVFLLGMNEKSFPQVIREDPILKDYYRRTLRDQLGFWINQKMERFDEERLLFFCMAEAAAEKLYLSFVRADGEGKPLVLSSYLVELARAARFSLDTAVRQISLWKVKNTDADLRYWTPKELSCALAAAHASADNYQAAGLLDETLRTVCEASKQITSLSALTPRDGIVSGGAAIFAEQNNQGLSPSALQDLAHCPMKYFFAKGIGLKETDEVFSRSELAPNLRGTAYHEVLKEYYQKLYRDGLTGQLFGAALQERLDQAFERHYTLVSYKQFGIYPVIWELILKDMHDKLSVFVQKDAEQLGNFVPSIFETYFEKVYIPSNDLKLKLKGIIDRIDIDKTHQTFRVIDYKSGRHGGKDLAADMFKYVILQPFIYLLLAQDSSYTRGLSADGAFLLNINQGYARQELSAAGFETVCGRAAQFVTMLTDFIQQGQFFINPGEHCTYCPYAAICRKDSFHTLLRARHAAAAKKLQEATR